MNELSAAPRMLFAYVGAHTDDADALEALAEYLPELRVPDADWGETEFAAGLSERWETALADRIAELERLRIRMADVVAILRLAGEDFVGTDVAGTLRLRDAARGPDLPDLDQSEAERLADGRALLSELASAAGLGRLPTAPANRESPGSEELMSCRAEHLTTLERAEDLLRDSGRLDFTAPSEYLRRLATVRPGVVGGRAEPLTALAACLEELLARHDVDTERLRQEWTGESGDAFGDYAANTATVLRGTIDRLNRLGGEAEELWRLLDTLLHDVAEAIWGHVAAVGESRIARISAAVELVEDVNGYAVTAVSERAMWGGLSGDEVDAAVQLLYKRVWYLANAMATLVSAAGEDAATRIGDEPGPASA